MVLGLVGGINFLIWMLIILLIFMLINILCDCCYFLFFVLGRVGWIKRVFGDGFGGVSNFIWREVFRKSGEVWFLVGRKFREMLGK